MLDTATPKLDPFDRFLDQHWVQRMGGLYSSAYLYIGASARQELECANENVMPNQARWERLAPQPPRSAVALYTVLPCFGTPSTSSDLDFSHFDTFIFQRYTRGSIPRTTRLQLEIRLLSNTTGRCLL